MSGFTLTVASPKVVIPSPVATGLMTTAAGAAATAEGRAFSDMPTTTKPVARIASVAFW